MVPDRLDQDISLDSIPPLKERIAQWETELARAEEELSSERAQRVASEKDLIKLQEQLKYLQALADHKKADLEQEIAEKDSLIKNLEQSLAAQREELAEIRRKLAEAVFASRAAIAEVGLLKKRVTQGEAVLDQARVEARRKHVQIETECSRLQQTATEWVRPVEASEAMLAATRAKLDEANLKCRAIDEQAALSREKLTEANLKSDAVTERVAQLQEQLLQIRAGAEQRKRIDPQLTEQLKLQVLQARKALTAANVQVETLRRQKLAAEDQVVKARETISYQLGYLLLHGFKSFKAFIALPGQLLALRQESRRRKAGKKRKQALITLIQPPKKSGAPGSPASAPGPDSLSARLSAFAVPGGGSVSPLKKGVSVIVPTYKGEATIEACLTSIAQQTLSPEDLEVVVVINGERDGTETKIAAVREKFPKTNFRVLVLDEGGVGNARNKGIEAATREFIAFVDDDDRVSQHYLAALLRHARPDTLTVSQIFDVVDGEVRDNPFNDQVRAAAKVRDVSYDDVSAVLTINACKLVPACILKQLAFDRSLRSGEDVDYWTRLILRFRPGIRVVPLAEEAIYYRYMRPNSVSRQPDSFDFNVSQRLDVIRNIDAVLPEAKSLEAFAASKIGAQAGFVVRYLKEHPEDYGRFNEIIAGREYNSSLVRFINAQLAETLVVSYCFPPYMDTAGVVTAKRIREMGRPVDVISNGMGKIRPTDPRLGRIVDDLLGETIELEAPESFANWQAIEAFAAAGLEQVERLEAQKGSYKTLYSRAMWPASHFAAAACKMRNPGVRWVAEFSDPLLLDIHGRKREGDLDRDWLARSGILAALAAAGETAPATDSLFFWCEYLPYVFADELVFTNENQLRYMLGYLPLPELAQQVRRKAVIKPQPTLPARYYELAESAYAVDRSCRNIGYFGSFYETRGFGDVFAALRGLTPEKRASIRFHVFTQQEDAIKKDPALADLMPNIVVNGYVGYLEFLNLTRRFDCLIVNDAATLGAKEINPYLPSKLSDYLGSGSAIWGVCEAGSVLDRLSREGGIAHRSVLGEPESHLRVLERLLAGSKF